MQPPAVLLLGLLGGYVLCLAQWQLAAGVFSWPRWRRVTAVPAVPVSAWSGLTTPAAHHLPISGGDRCMLEAGRLSQSVASADSYMLRCQLYLL